MALRKIFSSVKDNIVPDANVTYDLGNTTNQWKDLYLSGNTLNIGGASISVDANSGYMVFIPKPTESEANPKATVVSANGVATVETTAGVVNTAQVTAASSNTVSAGGGGGGGGSTTKTYRYTGRLGVNTGEVRKYFTSNNTMSTIDAFVATAPQGSSINIVCKKNGSNAESFSIAANTTSNTGIAANTSFVAGDYMTVDITQVGSSFAGQDLYVVFNF